MAWLQYEGNQCLVEASSTLAAALAFVGVWWRLPPLWRPFWALWVSSEDFLLYGGCSGFCGCLVETSFSMAAILGFGEY